MNRPTSIYMCCDPKTHEPRYVGKTVMPVWERIADHRCDKSDHYAARWFRKTKPYYFVAEVVPPGGDWVEAEQHWIAYLKSLGARLTNATLGGEGHTGRTFSAEHRDAISRGRMGIPSPNKGKKASEETRRKMSEAQKGNKNGLGVKRVVPMDHIERMNAARLAKPSKLKGTKLSDEIKKKLSDAHKGKKLSPEHKAKIAAANAGRVFSEEHRAKISAAKLGKSRKQREVI